MQQSPTNTLIITLFYSPISFPPKTQISDHIFPPTCLPMANNVRTNHHSTAYNVLGLFSILVLIQNCGAFEFMVGGSTGWTVPSDPNAAIYNQWAESKRFQIEDAIVFVYQGDKDSVLLVSEESYNNCNTENPLEHFNDGHTVIKFTHSGPHYFISGVKDNCHKNEKLHVVVMADRNNKSSSASPPPPPPPPQVVPSPAPSGEEAPSPPPGSATSPVADQTPPPPPPPPSAASSIILTFTSYIGAFLASSLLLVF